MSSACCVFISNYLKEKQLVEAGLWVWITRMVWCLNLRKYNLVWAANLHLKNDAVWWTITVLSNCKDTTTVWRWLRWSCRLCMDSAVGCSFAPPGQVWLIASLTAAFHRLTRLSVHYLNEHFTYWPPHRVHHCCPYLNANAQLHLHRKDIQVCRDLNACTTNRHFRQKSSSHCSFKVLYSTDDIATRYVSPGMAVSIGRPTTLFQTEIFQPLLDELSLNLVQRFIVSFICVPYHQVKISVPPILCFVTK